MITIEFAQEGQALRLTSDSVPVQFSDGLPVQIVVDANYANRIICNELILENKLKTLIRIDHHPEKDDINYKLRFVDPTYSASAEQIADLIKLIAPSSLDKKISQFLYLGIYTDSGRFFYDTTTARTHALVS